ncbi:uncharacterized protein LOC124379268 isoform X2 [Silurus meridionalis]|uniref:uncharacterized protein LOC124379268 isoform X2 n=1 Tax=Silurus meridionalis TaxID=175797 RepID=UPI001EEB5612|nr:uncharacterized protein LOC124379268 isoform X2 [Silurus meridionalis]
MKRSKGIKAAFFLASSRNDDPPPKQEDPTLLQSTLMGSIIQSPLLLPLPLPQRLPLSEELDYSKMCPKCSSILTAAVVPAGQNTSLLQCPQCSTTPLCEHCLYPCPDGTCTNQACHIVSLLLTCDRVKETSSNVYGCPLFRACPKCHNLMSHAGGCKYVRCDKCSHGYCFICLRVSKECRKDRDKYFSLTCSVPKAARQRFQT